MSPPVPPAAEPRPWGGWGLFTGVAGLLGALVFLMHARDVRMGDPLQLLGERYSLAQYPGVESAGQLLAAWFGHAAAVLAAAAMAAAALGFGMTALRVPRLPMPGPGLREILSLGIGFAFLALVMLGGGLAGMWYWVWPAAWIAGGCGLAWRERAGLKALRIPPAGSWEIAVVKTLFLIVAGLVIAVSLAPEVFYDSLVYHLADPVGWAKVHKVTRLPYNFFSNFPFTFEMLFGVGVLFGSDAVARLAHAAVSLAAAGVVGWTAAWIAGGAGAGWIAALIYLSTPLITGSAWMTGIDSGLVLYEVAMVLGFLIWWGRRRTSAGIFGESHWLMLAAAFGGLGMGVKYTVGMTVGLVGVGVALRVAAPDGRAALKGWLAVFLAGAAPWVLSNVAEFRDSIGMMAVARPALAVYAAAGVAGLAWLIRRFGTRRSAAGMLRAVAFGVVVSVFASPWMLKSWIFTGNPTYPFAFRTLGGIHTSGPRMDYQMGEFREFRFRPLKEWLIHPLHVTRISGQSGWSNNAACGALFLALLPFVLAFRGVDERVKVLGVAVLGRYLLWANVSNIVRYFAPGLALLGILIGVSLGRFCARFRPARLVGLGLVAAFSLVNLYGSLLIAQSSVSFLGYVLGLESERQFLFRQRFSYPAPPYPATTVMNRILPAGAGVVYVGEARAVFYRGRIVAPTVFDFPVVLDLCSESFTERDVSVKLRQLGVKYLYFNAAEAERTGGYRILDPPAPRTQELYERWWARHLKLLWKDDWHEVFEIVPRGADGPRTAALKFVLMPAYQELERLDRTAMVLLQNGDFERAEATARLLVEKAPQAARSREALAEALAYRGKNAESLAEFRRAAALGQVSPRLHMNISLVLRRLGRGAEADREWRKADELKAGFRGGER